MKLTILSLLTLLIFACTPAKDPADAKTRESNNEETAEEAILEETEEENPIADFMGKWTVDAATAGAQIDLDIAPGKFNMTMAGSSKDFTYTLLEDGSLQVEGETLRKPQRWVLKDLTSESVGVCWNPDSDKPKTIPFTRSEE